MIEINLLPQELRFVVKDKQPPPFDMAQVILAGKVLVGLVIFLHLFMGVSAALRSHNSKKLTAEWNGLEAERKRLQEYDLEYATLTKQVDKVRDMAARRILWAGKLHALSSHLPAGVWFTDLSVSAGEFALQGSVLAFETDEMFYIRQLIDGLNGDREFIADFKEFQLGAVQQRTIELYDVADFQIAGKLKGDGK